MAIKTLKRLYLHAYSFQKWVHAEEILIKLNVCLFNKRWKKSARLSKKTDSKPVYNEKYLKTKIKSYNRKIDLDFTNNKISKEGSQFICLSEILIDV